MLDLVFVYNLGVVGETGGSFPSGVKVRERVPFDLVVWFSPCELLGQDLLWFHR